MLADGGFVIGEEALEGGLVELAFGAGEQVEHALALRVELECAVFRSAENLAATVAGPSRVPLRFLDNQLLRRPFDRSDVAVAVAQDEGEPASVLGALGLLESAFERVLVEHLGDEHVTRDADAGAFDAHAVAPGPAQGDARGV